MKPKKRPRRVSSGLKPTPRPRPAGRSAAVAVAAPPGDRLKKQPEAFDIQTFLGSTGLERKLVKFATSGVVYRQGDPCDSVMYIQSGLVKISVVSATGRQAVVAMLGPGDFFGVGSLAGQPVRMESATATRGTEVLVVEQNDMARVCMSSTRCPTC